MLAVHRPSGSGHALVISADPGRIYLFFSIPWHHRAAASCESLSESVPDRIDRLSSMRDRPDRRSWWRVDHPDKRNVA